MRNPPSSTAPYMFKSYKQTNHVCPRARTKGINETFRKDPNEEENTIPRPYPHRSAILSPSSPPGVSSRKGKPKSSPKQAEYPASRIGGQDHTDRARARAAVSQSSAGGKKGKKMKSNQTRTPHLHCRGPSASAICLVYLTAYLFAHQCLISSPSSEGSRFHFSGSRACARPPPNLNHAHLDDRRGDFRHPVMFHTPPHTSLTQTKEWKAESHQ